MSMQRPPPPDDDAAPPDRPGIRREEYSQGKAHVSQPEKVERRAEEKAAGRSDKPAPEGNTPGGVSS